MIKRLEVVGLRGPFRHKELLPWHDHCGYEVAVAILLYSRQSGKNDLEYTQYDSIRKYRTVYSNFVRASPQANLAPWSLEDDSGGYTRFNQDKCRSLWFYRFMAGLKNWMGQDWIPNRAMSLNLLRELAYRTELRIAGEGDPEAKHRWVVFSAFLTVAYVVSLQGPEDFLLDLAG